MANYEFRQPYFVCQTNVYDSRVTIFPEIPNSARPGTERLRTCPESPDDRSDREKVRVKQDQPLRGIPNRRPSSRLLRFSATPDVTISLRRPRLICEIQFGDFLLSRLRPRTRFLTKTWVTQPFDTIQILSVGVEYRILNFFIDDRTFLLCVLDFG